MEQRQPIEHTGAWVFHLQQENTLQFHIAAGQGEREPLLIEGHDISLLLDYLYHHRDLIYEATHDQALLQMEAEQAQEAASAALESSHIILHRYLDDGTGRMSFDA
jgi:hypothetical protein